MTVNKNLKKKELHRFDVSDINIIF